MDTTLIVSFDAQHQMITYKQYCEILWKFCCKYVDWMWPKQNCIIQLEIAVFFLLLSNNLPVSTIEKFKAPILTPKRSSNSFQLQVDFLVLKDISSLYKLTNN